MTTPDLPLPESEFHYADPAENDEAQTLPITPFVDKIHYPTLGAPALLLGGATLSVMVSLPEKADPASVRLSLVNRHAGGGEVALSAEAPVLLSHGPQGKTGRRALYVVRADTKDIPAALYDLKLSSGAGDETQPNAVRLYAQITGNEKVVLCGDAQLHQDNSMCLRKFVDRMNARDDIAWIALIGDVCDNGVKSNLHMAKLVLAAGPGPVAHEYAWEMPRAHAILSTLNKPVVLVPGNHDGMTAYAEYREGEPTDAYLGPDPKNEVAYDGLHHYRRTFGPLYHAFTWGNTRYLAGNTFELDRHDRLGFHAIVANWGGWIRAAQAAWIDEELAAAHAAKQHKVVLFHHDPRGGSEGEQLGFYKDFRPFTYTSVLEILQGYMLYLSRNGRRGWQQEWMTRPGQIKDHPVKGLLTSLLKHEVWAVIMGHDNENWLETYFKGQHIFAVEPRTTDYAPEAAAADAKLVRGAEDAILDLDFQRLVDRLSALPEDDAEAVIGAAIERLDAGDRLEKQPEAYADPGVLRWPMTAKAPIHFLHVDDVGAYKHARDKHFEAYGYVVAQLEDGRPVEVTRFDLQNNAPRPPLELPRKG